MTTSLASAFPPGDFLAEELEARGWTQNDFASIIDRPAQLVSAIVSGKKEITEETAAQIAAALGTTPTYWLSLQNTYNLWRHGQSRDTERNLDKVKLRAKMNNHAPVSLLRKRGFIVSDNLEEQYKELCSLLEVNSLEDEATFLAAARRSNTIEKPTSMQVTWLACARQIARSQETESYDAVAFQRLAQSLTRTIRVAADWTALPTRFAQVGVRLVHVEAFPANKISGASFLLDGDTNRPVIALSGLGKRFDKVMFTLLHEVAHHILGHVTADQSRIDDASVDGDVAEEEADQLASSWALPLGKTTPPRVIRKPWILEESQRQGVNPLMLIGTLQHDGRLDWRTELVRGAERVDSYLSAW